MKIALKMLFVLCLSIIILITLMIAGSKSPYISGYVFGDDKLRKLYHFYKVSKNETSLNSVKRYAAELEIVEDDQITLAGEKLPCCSIAFYFPEHSADTVFVWHEGDRITNVVYSPD